MNIAKMMEPIGEFPGDKAVKDQWVVHYTIATVFGKQLILLVGELTNAQEEFLGKCTLPVPIEPFIKKLLNL
jgi:hypothetical protein